MCENEEMVARVSAESVGKIASNGADVGLELWLARLRGSVTGEGGGLVLTAICEILDEIVSDQKKKFLVYFVLSCGNFFRRL